MENDLDLLMAEARGEQPPSKCKREASRLPPLAGSFPFLISRPWESSID